jgi:hypothetical protein
MADTTDSADFTPTKQQQFSSAAGKGGLVSGITGGIGMAIGAAIAQGDFEKARQLQQQAMSVLQGLNPDQLAQVRAEVGETAFANMTVPPEGRQAQLMALQKMQEMATGTSPEDAAAYARAQAEAAQVQRGIQQAALQRLAQRGVSGTSGLALAAQQDAAQAATQQAATRDLDVAAEARRRALQALAQQGGLAGQLRGADYEQAAARAQAQDLINRFNAQQRMQQAQSVYDAQARKAGALSGAYGNQAGLYQQQGAQDIATGQVAGSAVGSAGDAALMALGKGLL